MKNNHLNFNNLATQKIIGKCYSTNKVRSMFDIVLSTEMTFEIPGTQLVYDA